jgi:two-component system nitrate/nitrite response regulator NarL
MEIGSSTAEVADARERRPCGLLIDPQALFREGLKLVLEAIGYRIGAEMDDASAALRAVEGGSRPDFVVLTLRPGHGEAGAIGTLRECLPQTRLIVFADTATDPSLLVKSMRAGADGYVLLDVRPDVLRQSLELIMLGERVFPAAMLMNLLDQGGLGANEDAHPGAPFSPRDEEILRCLAQGYSNKMIAHAIGTTEATTKAHIKSILQKVGAANRTQAATWAVSKGFAATAAHHPAATEPRPSFLTRNRRNTDTGGAEIPLAPSQPARLRTSGAE